MMDDDAATRTYWLSFADGGFLGAVIIHVHARTAAAVKPLLPPTAQPDAEWILAATQIARSLGCHPGGSVLAVRLPMAPAPEWCERLLTEDEARRLVALLGPH